jgi:hypothetical protein
LIQQWQQQGLVERVSSAYKLTEWGALWYNHAQLELLPIHELAKSLRLFGSLDSQRQLLNTEFNELSGYEQEMLTMFGFNKDGRSLRSKLYKGYLDVRRLPFFDNRAIGFTGPVDREL